MPTSGGSGSRGDSTIWHDVLEEVEWDNALHNCVIGVSVHDGVVTLTGHVPAETQQIAAEAAARRVRGVTSVINEVTVE
jgi:osmotically-inducible protein OsmY